MSQTNERSFTSEAAKWMTQILDKRLDLPFKDVRVEKPVKGTQKRHDLVIVGRDGHPVIAGEVRMPDRLNGSSPFNETVAWMLKTKPPGLAWHISSRSSLQIDCLILHKMQMAPSTIQTKKPSADMAGPHPAAAGPITAPALR